MFASPGDERWRWLVLFTALVFGGGCRSVTSVRVEIAAAPGLKASSLTLEVTENGAPSLQRALSGSGGGLALPGVLILRVGDDATQITIKVTGSDQVGRAIGGVRTVTTLPHQEVPLALTLDLPMSGYRDLVLKDGPLAYYRLDETVRSVALDSSPNGLHATYGTSVSQQAPSLLATDSDPAATFPGGGFAQASTVFAPPSPTLQPREVSIEVWFKQPKVNTAAFPALVSYGNYAVAGQAYTLQLDPMSGRLDFYVRTKIGSRGLQSTSVPQGNTVYHVVATYGGGAQLLYTNGVLDCNPNSTMPPLGCAVQTPSDLDGYDPTAGLAIGNAFNGDRDSFAGTIDEVAIYGTVLSADRIAAHYRAGAIRP